MFPYNLLGFKGSASTNFSIAVMYHKYYLNNTHIINLNLKTIGLMHFLILFLREKI